MDGYGLVCGDISQLLISKCDRRNLVYNDDKNGACDDSDWCETMPCEETCSDNLVLQDDVALLQLVHHLTILPPC